MSHTTALAAVFSNLAKASEKQQFFEAAGLYDQLAAVYSEDAAEEGTLEELREALVLDITTGYPAIEAAGTEVADRGVLRAARWGEKVTTSQRALIDRYLSKGEELLEGGKLFVCEACGFIFLGQDPPPVCPACKAPARRFSAIK